MKEETISRDNQHNGVVIILPETEVSPLKRFTLFLLGFSGALLFTAFINFNESLVIIVLGIVLFLFIYDEGFRRVFK